MKSPTKTPLVGLMIVDSHEQVRYWQMHYRTPVWRLVLVGFSSFQAITACPVKRRREISMQVQNEKESRIIPSQRCGSLNPCSDAVLQGGAAIAFPSLTDFQVDPGDPWLWNSVSTQHRRVHGLESGCDQHHTRSHRPSRSDRDKASSSYQVPSHHPAHGSSSSGTHQLTEVPARNTVIGPW